MIRAIVLATVLSACASAATAASPSLPLADDPTTRDQSADPKSAAGLKLFGAADYALGDDVAPSFGDDLSDRKTKVTAGVEGEAAINSALKVTGTFSTTYTQDFLKADKDGSGFTGAARLGVDDKAYPLAPFLKYGVERTYKELFGGYDRTDQTFTAGFIVNVPVGKLGLKITPTIAYTKSDNNLKERATPGVTLAVERVAFRNVKWTMEAAYEEQRFELAGAGMSTRRHDKRFQAYFGADLVSLLELIPGDRDLAIFKNIKVGARYVRHESNAPDPIESYKRLQFVPTIRLERKIGG